MITFSEIPEFVIDQYLSEMDSKFTPPSYPALYWYTVVSGDDSVIFVNGNFTFDHGIGTVFFKNYQWLTVWNDNDFSLGVKTESKTTKLIGPNTVIMSKGSDRLPVYVETETEYKEI
jgi:hypothetical protein